MEQIKDNRTSLAIGAVRVLRLAEEYEKLGYLVLTNPETHSGVDLVIISLPDGRIQKVIECTNWKDGHWKMDSDRFERYVASLTYFEVIDGIELELVLTSLDNLTAKQADELKKNHIHVTVRPVQDVESE
jgi:hypothetical protein